LPDTLEALVCRSGHFRKAYAAKKFFALPSNINGAIEANASELLG